MTLNNLAVLLRSRGVFDEAATLCRRALAIFDQVLGPDHPHTVTCRENHARLVRPEGSASVRPGVPGRS
jgi:hypothetical protein